MLDTSTLLEIKKNKTGFGILIENDGFIKNEGDKNAETLKNLKESIENFSDVKIPSPFIVDAVFQKYDVKNANGRIYPESVLKREVDKYQTLIKENRSFGELNHPSSSSIDGSRISHIIKELHWEGKTLVGKLGLHLSPGYIKYGVVSTTGDMVANLLLSGYKIGVSSRGLGSVEQDRLGQYIVGDDFELVCWDIVTDPSTPNAYIASNKEELSNYVESKESKEKNNIFEKLSKIEELLA